MLSYLSISAFENTLTKVADMKIKTKLHIESRLHLSYRLLTLPASVLTNRDTLDTMIICQRRDPWYSPPF